MAEDKTICFLTTLDNVESSDIPRSIYERVSEYCKTNPSKKDEVKGIFVNCLDKYIENLISGNKFEEVFNCFLHSQQLYPEDGDIFNTLGVALNRLQRPIESLEYFQRALKLCSTKMKIVENIENVINEWVPRWHFTMLNDMNRNMQYKNAISSKIKEGHKTVLDIGCGTGLLSLYASFTGAQKVFACETNEIMIEIAEKVFQENNVNVQLIPKHSTKLTKSDFRNQKIDLIVTEIFDSGAFGEGALSTLIHAVENLLSETGKVLPEGIEIYVVGVSDANVRETRETLDCTFENSIYLKKTLLHPTNEGPYETINLRNSKLQLITQSELAFKVDFNSLESLKSALEGKLDRKIQLSCRDECVIEGFLVYFKLILDKDLSLNNFDPEDIEQSYMNCWEPILFTLNQSLPVRTYQILDVEVSCKDGVLALKHDYDNRVQNDVFLKVDTFNFLTDDEYIYELEYNVEKLMKKRGKFQIFADFLPFPHIGINLLKERKIEKLYCLNTSKDFIEEVASWNCIPRNSLIYIDDFENLLSLNLKFDLILLQPLTHYGTLNEDHLKYYENLKNHSLTPNGTIFPTRIDVCCKLIHSNWLDHVSKVGNEELKTLKIQEFINKYSTKHQFEFQNYDSTDLTDVFSPGPVHFDEHLHENSLIVNLNCNEPLIMNGILYWYKIYFLNNNNGQPILTNRRKSFCKINCFVQNVDVRNKKSLCFKFIQNEFVFRCYVQS